MIDYFNSLEVWQKAVLIVLAVFLIVSVAIYIHEVHHYRSKKRVQKVELSFVKFTEESQILVGYETKAKVEKSSLININGLPKKFLLDPKKKMILIKVSDIYESEFVFDFLSEDGRIFAKGVLFVDENAERPVKEEPVEEPAPAEEPVEEPAPAEEPVEEPAPAEEPVEEPAPAEEPVEEPAPAEEPAEEPSPAEEPAEEAAPAEEAEGDGEESETIIENGMQIVITYDYSFDARLIQADEETRNWYRRLIYELDSYSNLKYKQSWKKIRVYTGRKTLAIIKFRGKKLSVAYALDPKKYEETKYKGYDLSDKKAYQDTPMMLKTTSDRRLSYQLHLLNDVCSENNLTQGEVVEKKIKISPYMNRDKLIEKELVKVKRKETPIVIETTVPVEQ